MIERPSCCWQGGVLICVMGNYGLSGGVLAHCTNQVPNIPLNLAVTCCAEVLWLENVCGTCIFVSNFLNLFGILWVKNFKLDPTLYVVY